MRAFRFIAQFSLSVEKNTRELLIEDENLIHGLKKETVQEKN